MDAQEIYTWSGLKFSGTTVFITSLPASHPGQGPPWNIMVCPMFRRQPSPIQQDNVATSGEPKAQGGYKIQTAAEDAPSRQMFSAETFS